MRFAGNTGRKKSPSVQHRTTFSGWIFATEACIDNREKPVKQQCLPHMSSQYGELRPTSDWDLLASFGHPCKFQRVLCLGSVTARHSSSGRQPNFAALNRGRHLYSAGRPSRWALAHISSYLLNSRHSLAQWLMRQTLASVTQGQWWDFKLVYRRTGGHIARRHFHLSNFFTL